MANCGEAQSNEPFSQRFVPARVLWEKGKSWHRSGEISKRLQKRGLCEERVREGRFY